MLFSIPERPQILTAAGADMISPCVAKHLFLTFPGKIFTHGLPV